MLRKIKYRFIIPLRTWPVTKFYRFTYWSSKVVKAIICTVVYRLDQFSEHFHGPNYRAAIQEYDNDLKAKLDWSGENGSYDEARDMLYETMHERGLKIWD